MQRGKIFILLAFLLFAAYLNSLGNAFVADDIPAIVENTNIGNLNFVFANPLAFIQPLLYFLTNKLFGLNPFFFHLTNVFSHLAATYAAYILVGLLISPATALIAAAIFAVHPILTESVTWISGGYYARYSAFILLGLIFYILSAQKRRFYLFSILSFLLALFVTEKAVVFPFILLAYVFAFGKIKKDWPKLIVPFIVGAVFFVIYASGITQRVEALQTQFYQEPQTLNPLVQVPIAITSYLKLTFWPKDLTLYHSEMSFTQTQYFLHLLVFLVFLGIIAYCSRSLRNSQGSTFEKVEPFRTQRIIFFWLSFFIISLLPMLTPFGISWIVAERYVYLGSLGVFVVVAMVLQKAGQLLKNPNVPYAILAILVLLLGRRTIHRNQDWQNQDTLWLATAKTSPSSPQNHNNLGDLYGRRGEFEKAVEEFQRAIELKPGYADAYHNLGNTYQQMGKVDEAIESFEKAIEASPNLWQSYQNLAAIYFEQENYTKAKNYLEKATNVNPKNDNLFLNLGIINLKLGEKEKAKQALEQALKIDPANQTAQQLLSTIVP